MARPADRYEDNAPGPFYVDRSCIDCGTCRVVAPGVFGDAPDHAFVQAQPSDAAARLRASMALVACPTASIGTDDRTDLHAAAHAFPDEVVPGVHHCGYASPDSYGASSWFVRRPDGNVLVDSPRAAAPLLTGLEALGGVRWMFLTHRDDVADHAKIAAHFGATRLIHRGDRTAATADVEEVFDGDTPIVLAPDLRIVPVPGHTRGSAALLWNEEVLFSGDHVWGTEAGHLGAGRSVCWWSWPEQIRSMDRLLDHRFGHVLPGHGRPWHGGHERRRPELERLVGWMRGRG
jgi:glyoxylase-like metal-dependent hydrolase (beta-lactamase superfamily II)